MKKIILLISVLTMSLGVFAQPFVDGSNYFLLDYTTGGATSSCISTIANSNGGLYFPNNNIPTYGYKDNITNTEDAVMFNTDGNFLDANDYPFYCDIFYTNSDDYSPAQCEDMKSAALVSSAVGIDMSNPADAIIKVTAKASVDGLKAVFDVTNSADGNGSGNWPSTMFNPWAGTIDLTTELTLTTSYQEYTIDLTGSADWSAFSLKNKINMWGIAMYEDGIVWVQKIEFGTAPVASKKEVVVAKNFTLYPNPSAGFVTVNTKNNAGKLVITDMMGSIVESIQTSKGQDSYQVNLDTKGMYFLNFHTNDGNVSSEKLIIE